MSRRQRIIRACRSFIDRHQVVSRLALLWAIGLTTFTVERVTRPDVLQDMTAPGATVATGAIGILSTVVGLYRTVAKINAKQESQDAGGATDQVSAE